VIATAPHQLSIVIVCLQVGGDIVATTDHDMCGMCQYPLQDGNHAVQTLTCAHKFHTVCVEETLSVTMKTLDSLECPVCRRTADDMMAAEGRLLDNIDGEPISSSEGGADAPYGSGDAAEPPPVAAALSKAPPRVRVRSRVKAKAPCKAAATVAGVRQKAARVAPQKAAGLRSKAARAAPPKAAGVLPKAAVVAPPKAAGVRPRAASAAAAALPKAAGVPPNAVAVPKMTGVTDCPAFLVDNTLRCMDCGHEARIVNNVRLRAKCTNSWRCEKCNVTHTQLHRKFGSWPTGAFKQVSDEHKRAFYSELRDKGVKHVLAYTQDFLKQYESHEDFYAEGGEFLPLSVWSTRGFDTEAIETKSKDTDIRDHVVLGKTYRVPIYSAGKRGVKGHGRENVEDAKKSSAKRLKPTPEAGAASSAAAGRETAAVPSDTSSSSSSESSSTSSRKKKKKSKKDKKRKSKKDKKSKSKKDKKKDAESKKERLARDREEAAANRGVQKEKDAAIKVANGIADKLCTAMTSLETTVGHGRFRDLPLVCQETAKEMINKLKDISADCEKVRTSDHTHMIRHVDPTNVRALAADAKKKQEWVMQMIAMLSRA